MTYNKKLNSRFRFSVRAFRSRQAVRMYRDKYSELIRTCMAVKHSVVDYQDLPKLRTIVETAGVAELAPALVEHGNPDIRRLLLDCTPIFNSAPRDLKAFILLSAGIRSHHIEGEAP